MLSRYGQALSLLLHGWAIKRKAFDIIVCLSKAGIMAACDFNPSRSIISSYRMTVLLLRSASISNSYWTHSGQVNMATTRSGASMETELETPWDFPGPFTISITPSANEIDGLNHTNNAVYVQWCEAVAWSHSRSIGLDISDYHRLDRGMAIRRGEYDYLLPSSLGDTLILGTWLTASDGKLTLERRFQLVREVDFATILRGRWELVCIQLSSGGVRRMPLEFRQVYLPALCFQDDRHSPNGVDAS